MSDRVSILGIPLDALTIKEAISRIQKLLLEEGVSHVMTPNSEMLVHATSHPRFRSVLQHSALNLPDSAGLLFAAKWTGQHLPERIAGVDAVEQLCRTLTEEHPVFFLGGKNGAGLRASTILQKQNPRLRIAGVYEGSPSSDDAPAIIQRINASGARVLFVAYGAPQQDLWIADHSTQLTTVRLAMGVGGTFDFLAGDIRRAPSWMRSLYLEWLWRLLLEPRRIMRILKATVVFPVMVLLLSTHRN